jgi:hypothetical protein
MREIKNITITPEILKLIAEIDEFDRPRQAIEILAPEKLSSLKYGWTREHSPLMLFKSVNYGPLDGQKRESLDMKTKMLLFGSVSAMVLGTVMLIMPANASVSSGCASKNCEQNTGHLIIASCQAVANGGCACPLPHPTFNNCVITGADGRWSGKKLPFQRLQTLCASLYDALKHRRSVRSPKNFGNQPRV